MINKLCGYCGGKGFHWVAGDIVSRVDGTKLATTYREGPKCGACNGTGQHDHSLTIMAACAIAAALIAAAILLIGPLFK